MNGRVYPQVPSSETSTLEAVPVINSAQILSSYRRMDDDSREKLCDDMQQVENQLLIEKYNRLNDAERLELFTSLNEIKKNVILSHYLADLGNSVSSLERQHHVAADLSRSLVEQLTSLQSKGFHHNIKAENFLDVVHKTTAFIQTPPFNQDMTPNPAFEQRSNELTASSNALRSSGKWELFHGIISTIQTLMMIGASVMLGLHLGGIIGHASTMLHAFAALCFTVNTYFGIKDAVSAVGHFSSAHRSFSVSNKLNALVKIAQPAQPAAVEPATENKTKPSM